jgi:hypothetical protein
MVGFWLVFLLTKQPGFLFLKKAGLFLPLLII